jgi:hypothetical protein
VLGHRNRFFDGFPQRTLFLDLDKVFLADLEGGNVHSAAVDGNMTVADELPGLLPGSREAEAENDVVESSLQVLQEDFTRHALLAVRVVKGVPELAFHHAVDASYLLFLPQSNTVIRNLALPLTVLAGRVTPAFDGALGAETPFPLEEKLHTFTAAKPANGTSIPGQ